MSDDWYRRTNWTEEDQVAFFDRLNRSRSQHNKAQYLRIQAGYLEDDYPLEALKLLEILFNEYPEPSQLASAFLQKAHCLVSLSREDDSVEAFRDVLKYEEKYPKYQTEGYLDFPLFIITHKRKELYQEAKDILILYADRLMFPVDYYKYHTVLAVIEWQAKNIENAKAHVIEAKKASEEKQSGFRYHPNVGLVKEQDDEIQKEFKEIEEA
jgi:hypothetical protein